MSTLVIGAGELGTAILAALASHASRSASRPLAVLLRPSTLTASDPIKLSLLSHLQSQNITLVAGDIAADSAPALAEVFKHHRTVVGASGMAAPPGTQLKLAKAVIAASRAPDSHLRRYIPWQFGLDYDAIGRGSAQGLFTEQLDVRDALKAAAGESKDALGWTILSTGIFMTFLFESAFGVVELPKAGAEAGMEKSGIVRALGSWEQRVTYTSPRDIGRLTAEVVYSGSEMKNQVVFIAGETASFATIKAAVEKALGHEVEGELWSIEHLTDSLREDPDNGMKKYRVILGEGVGVAWDMDKTLNAQRRIPTQTVEDYAVESCRPS